MSRAALEDHMGSWEASGERPEGVWRRFGGSLTGFRGIFRDCFSTKEVVIWNIKSKGGRDLFFNSRKHTTRFVSDKFEEKTVANAVESARSVCRRARIMVLQFRFRCRWKWPQAF